MTTTITIEVDKRTKSGKAFLAMVDTFLKGQTGIKVVEGKAESEKSMKKKMTEAEIMKLSKEVNKNLRLRMDKVQLINELSKKTNKALTKRLLAEHDISYPL